MPHTIRPMTAVDLPAARELWQGVPGIVLYPVDDSPETLTNFIKRNPRTCFIAEEEDGVLIGVILGGFDGRRAYIYHMCVREDCQRRGIGREMVNITAQALKNEGAGKVSLFTMADNKNGEAFWEAIGFTVRDDVRLWDLRF